MPDRNYTIVFDANTTSAITGIGTIATALKALDVEVKAVGSGMGQLGAQANNAANQLGQTADALTRTAQGAKGAHQELMKLPGAFMAMQAGIAVATNFGEAINNARDRIKEMTEEVMDLRDKMRELANLQGKPGPDNEVMAEAAKLGIQAGMMPPEAVKYLEQFEGSSPAGVQKGHIDERTKREMMVEGAKFGTRVGLMPATAGDLAGVIPQYSNLTKDKDGKDIPQDERMAMGMAQMGRVAYGLNEGRGKLEPLVRSLINTAGAVVRMGGPVEDMGELAAIQGVASTHSNTKESGTRVRQAVRALRDMTGPAGMYMEHVGIKNGMTHMQRLEKLRGDVDKADKSGVGADTFLLGQGFTDQDEVRSIVEEVRDYDVTQQRIAKSKTITGASVMAQDEAFLTTERVGIRRRQMANKAGQEIIIGERSERFEMAKETAEQELIKDKTFGGQFNAMGAMMADGFGVLPLLGKEKYKEQKKATRAEDNLVKEARAKGIPETDIFLLLSNGNAWSEHVYKRDESYHLSHQVMRSEAERLTGFNKLADRVEASGGNAIGVGPNIGKDLDKMKADEKRVHDQQAVVKADEKKVRDQQAAVKAGMVALPDGQWIIPQTEFGREARLGGGRELKTKLSDKELSGGYGNKPALEEARRNGDNKLAAKLEKLIQVTEQTNRILAAQGKGPPAGATNPAAPTAVPPMRAAAMPKRP